MNISGINFPRRSWYYLILTITTMVVIFLTALNPTWKEVDRLEMKKSELKLTIEEQQLLRPIYAGMMQAMKREESLLAENINLNNSDSVDVDQAVQILENIAQTNRLDETSFSPVPESLTRKENKMVVRANIAGSYDSITGFFSSLAEQAFFIEYERVEIMSRAAGFETVLRFWVQVS